MSSSVQAGRMVFERVIETRGSWACVAGRFAVYLFEGQLPLADMDHLEAIGARWRREHPEKTVDLVIVLPSDVILSQAERTRMAHLIKRWETQRLASATVILAEGLWGAVQRSMLTGLMLIAPPPHPAKVFGTIDGAVAYLAPHLARLPQQPHGVAEAQQAVRQLYDAFRARPRSVPHRKTMETP